MQRWEIKDDFREIMVARLRLVVETGNDEIALKAITEARHMEQQNQRDEHHKVTRELEQIRDQLAALINSGPNRSIDGYARGVTDRTSADVDWTGQGRNEETD